MTLVALLVIRCMLVAPEYLAAAVRASCLDDLGFYLNGHYSTSLLFLNRRQPQAGAPPSLPAQLPDQQCPSIFLPWWRTRACPHLQGTSEVSNIRLATSAEHIGAGFTVFPLLLVS